MKKFLKWLAAILAVGSVVGIVIAYLCKESKDEDEDFRFNCDDDDYDLDSDLQPVSERGYVSLKKSGAETEPVAAEAVDKDSAAEKSAAEAVDKDSAAEKSAEEALADDPKEPEENASVQPESEISDK
ncbi:hypothetical protein DW655_06020 [Lachnospiraceae bacterium AM23-2LB]|nr:hypothetical protein DW655_06020 [Lachnospiraceae bacterium AM23-2LB]RJW04726.1 hypothetical protein DW887_03270 [Lachnospiraceae bacterium AM40-2BH]